MINSPPRHRSVVRVSHGSHYKNEIGKPSNMVSFLKEMITVLQGLLYVFLIFGIISIFIPEVVDYLAWLDREAELPSKDKYEKPTSSSKTTTRVIGVIITIVSLYLLIT